MLISRAERFFLFLILSLRRDYPFALLEASGEAVGLSAGTVGNSEAGHLHLGAGRRIFSDRERINQALKDGSFYDNASFLWAIDRAKAELE